MRDSKMRRFWPAILRRLGMARWLNYNHALTVSGRTFLIPVQGGLGENLLKLTPDFKSEIIRLFGERLPDCFVDIGANLGQTIIDAFSVRSWGRYIALEPNPVAFAYLESLVKANHLPVERLPWAAGAEASPHNFCSQGTADPAATMAPQGRPGVYSPGMSQWVATYPLDLLIDLAALPSGVLMKIDVEGFEADVLAGATRILRDIRPVILCEILRAYVEPSIAFTNERMSKVEKILADQRYRIFYIEMENETSGRIRALREISSFPRGLWKDNPTGMDYLFVPAEMALPAFTGSGGLSLVREA